MKDGQPILGLQTSEQMHLVKIQDNNFHRVQDDSCFNSLSDDKLEEFPDEQHLIINPEVCPQDHGLPLDIHGHSTAT